MALFASMPRTTTSFSLLKWMQHQHPPTASTISIGICWFRRELNCLCRDHSGTWTRRPGVEIRSLLGYCRGVEISQNTSLRIGGWRSSVHKAKPYDVFGDGKPGDEEYRKAWEKEMDEATCVWSGSDSEDEKLRSQALKKYYDLSDTDNEKGNDGKKHAEDFVQDNSDDIDADFSDELRSVWSGSDEEKTLWSGPEDDLEDDIPPIARPNERSDKYIDEIFEFDEVPKLRTLSELINGESKKEELNPGRQARKLAMENALKKLKKGPDGRYINVFDVMTDMDVLIGSFEEVINEPEYADLRAGGPKKLNMQFFKDLQKRLRDGNFEFTPELQLKPKSRFVLKKKYLRAKARERKWK